jgi:gliding motility-associated-like protein
MCDTGTVIFTVTAVNDAPVAVNDAVTINEDTDATGNVLTNDTDVEGDALTASLITAPGHGTVVLNSDGSFTYTPNKDYNGLDSLKYKVCDNGTPSMCDTGTVIFTVTAVNDAPVAVNDAVTVNEDTDATGNLLTNDTDVEGDALTASLITAPVHGTVVLNSDGSFTYTPNKDYNGLDSLKYKVCDNGTPSMCDTGTVIFTVTAVNDAPVAVNDAVTVAEDTDGIGNVLTNDTDVEGDALTASLITVPVHGTVVLNSDGSFTYTPNKDYNGVDSLKYRVCDNGTPSMCDTGTVIFTVTAVNDAPVAVNDAVTVNEDTDATGNVLTNDTDVEGDALTASLITAPVHGTVVLNSDGSFTYTPNKDYNGLDRLKYRVCDNGTPSMCDTGTVIFTVTAVNDAPVAVNDAVTINEDTDATGNVLTNDTDPEGDALTASLITAPVHGTVVLNSDGSFTYTPNKDYNGLDSLKYRVCDNGTPSMCDTGTVIFTVTAVNDAPVAVDDAVTLQEDHTATGNVLTNDSDIEGDALTATLITAPVNGTVVLDAAGNFTYTPNANFHGTDSLIYKVCDNGTPGMCDTAVLRFTITAVNHAPNAVDDIISAFEDEPYSGNVLSNDSDPDGDLLSASLITGPVNGTLTLDATGSFVYTPNANFNGTDSIVYKVCDNGTPSLCDTAVVRFTVAPVNDEPVVTGGNTTITEQNKPVKDTLTANDPDGDPLTFSKGDDPTHGSVVVDGDGSYTYTPTPGYTGDDTFTIIIDDGTGNPKTVTVTVTVTPPTNNPPVVSGGYDVSTEQDKPIVDTLVANDPDGDPLTFSKGSDPAHGTVDVNTDGTYTYTPEPGYTGTDTFTIIVDDGHGDPKTVTVTVTVTPPNQAPVITGGETTTTEQGQPVNGTLTATDPEGDPITFDKGNDPAHGTVVVNADGTYTYTPEPGYTGDDSFTIIVKDDKGNETEVTVDVTVTPSNQAPVITGGETTTTEQGQPVNGTLTATDPDGDPITFDKGNDPAHGTVVVNADGTYTYTPEPGYTGDDSFTIIVKDDKGNETEVTVDVTVTPPNQAPVVTGGETLTTEQDKPGTGTMTATDPEGGPLTFEKGDDPAHGSVVVNADGTYTYTPEPGYTGNDTFTIIVKDDKGKTTTVAVSVTVTPDNSNNPVAVDDSVTVIANTPLDIDVLANDSARTSTFEPGSITIIDQPAHGSVVVNSNGTVTYTPATGYTGEDTFTYQVKTADGKTTNTATVRISASFAEITVPTLFTPNGDGRNDVFEIRGLSQYAETELIIVNRWGNEVYRQKNYQNTWKGDGLNEGTYFYLLRIKRTASSGWEVIKGYTTLVRNFNN